MKKKTTEQYNRELKELGLDIKCEKYEGALISISHSCSYNHTWKTSPSKVLVSSGCPYCLGKQTSSHWSEEEINILKENYFSKGTEWCSNTLNRSLHSVRLKASRLGIKGKNHRLKTHETYEKELMNIEADAYPLQEYINASTPILHTCINDHEWKAAPSDILRGTGCPICTAQGFNPGKPAILYYLKLKHEGKFYFKIGITGKSINSRIRREDRQKIVSILLEKKYENGQEAKNKEQEILKTFEPYKAYKDILKSGNSEIFIWDVLQLDHT